MTALSPILVTGFEPFGGEAQNTSWLLAQQLDGLTLGGRPVVARCLPVAFQHSLAALRAALRSVQPGWVLAIGEAGGRRALSFERVAVNLIDARIPDNEGLQPVDVPVQPNGPAAYFSTLPLKAMLAAVQAQGIAVELSMSAGSYVCNQVFYGLQHQLHRRSEVRSGFLHVPKVQGAQPVLALDDLVRGTRVALEAALAHPAGDVRGLSAGTLD